MSTPDGKWVRDLIAREITDAIASTAAGTAVTGEELRRRADACTMLIMGRLLEPRAAAPPDPRR